jgi:hypothetical protein
MKTTSFELSKKIKELGFIRESDHTFIQQLGIKAISKESLSLLTQLETETASPYFKAPKDLYINAYTLDEILEMLPVYVHVICNCDCDCDSHNELHMGISVHNGIRGLYIGYGDKVSFDNKNPAEAAGQLLVWCIENGYVVTEENNEK